MQLPVYDVVTPLTQAQENATAAGWSQDQMADLNKITQAEVAGGEGTITALLAKYNGVIAWIPTPNPAADNGGEDGQ